MSQASRRTATAPQRERRRVAKAIAMLEVPVEDVAQAADFMLRGIAGFDVARANEHAESLIALEATQDAFEAWTREQGLGPENRESGAFSDRDCEPCGGLGYWEEDDGSAGGACAWCDDGLSRGGWPGKLARQWTGDRRAPMGRSLAKLGRAIQRALKGQPSECQTCKGEREVLLPARTKPASRRVSAFQSAVPCPSCHGSGHLRGVLPPVEWSAQVRRCLADSCHATESVVDDYEPLAAWQRPLVEGLDMAESEAWVDVSNSPGRTRVVPRGTHRDIEWGRDLGLDQKITDRRELWAIASDTDKSRLPRRMRGDIRHAEQRRKRGQS